METRLLTVDAGDVDECHHAIALNHLLAALRSHVSDDGYLQSNRAKKSVHVGRVITGSNHKVCYF